MKIRDIKTLGFWSSWITVFFGFAYSVPQLLSAFKILPHPQDLFWLFLPSLFLAPSFLIVMICLHFVVKDEVKIWTAIGAAFAVVYCVMVTIVYFSQLTVVLPSELEGETENLNLLLFEPRSFLTAIDCLGYFFMSLSTLFASFAFKNVVKYNHIQRGLFWNGVLLPVLILAFFYPIFYYIGAVWMFSFPFAMINAAILFKNLPKTHFKVNLEYED